jgi:hypothetical protein
MKKYILILSVVALFASLDGVFAATPPTDGEYGVVIDGYDWGPAVTKPLPAGSR